jgi:hypothetical protein
VFNVVLCQVLSQNRRMGINNIHACMHAHAHAHTFLKDYHQVGSVLPGLLTTITGHLHAWGAWGGVQGSGAGASNKIIEERFTAISKQVEFIAACERMHIRSQKRLDNLPVTTMPRQLRLLNIS